MFGASAQLSVNSGNNQFNSGGFGYDLAGNMTGDGLYSYAWNGAGLLKSAGGVTYTYDGNGNRVQKSTGVFYWRGVDGNVLAETDTSGNPINEYVFFAGGRIARRDASGSVYYYFPDMLGSDVAITNATGVVCYDADFYPFGGEKSRHSPTLARRTTNLRAWSATARRAWTTRCSGNTPRHTAAG